MATATSSATDVVMPRLSDSMEEGTILTWLKAAGEQVAVGEDLVEIETDKASMTYQADAAGELTILAGEGETVPLGGVIARIGEPGAAAGETAPAAPASTTGNGGRGKASPLARRIARELGVSLAGIAGSGPRGRIVKADVLASAGDAASAQQPTPAAAAPAAAAPAPASSASGKGDVIVQQLTRQQQTAARRMAEAKATIPDFSISLDVDMAPAVDLRAQLKRAAGEGAVAPSYNDLVVKAAALALREEPRANGSYRDGTYELYSRVNVGIAVAAEDALIVPTIFDADGKSIGQVAREARELAERVRSGTITPPELSGATFTVSNIGMFGIAQFTPVINPPQAAILAVGALRETPVVVDGRLAPGLRMTLTLTCDHRILNGADGARFLSRICALLESPLRLTL